MVITALDLSINGSGCVQFELDKKLNIKNKKFMAFSTVKKNKSDSIIYYTKKQFKDYIAQTIWMFEQIFSFCDTSDYVAIEDYAYAATGNVFHIGEFCGYIKHRLYEYQYPMRLYEPTTIKKYGVKGNADKILMEETYDALPEKEKFPELDSLNRGGKSPRCDVIDAYFMAKLLQLELKIRKGMITVQELTDKEREIFNRTSKRYPENLLCRPFLSTDDRS